MVSSVLLPLLSFLLAIFQDFLGVATSVPHLGHLAIRLPIHKLQMIDKAFSLLFLSSLKQTIKEPVKMHVELNLRNVKSFSATKRANWFLAYYASSHSLLTSSMEYFMSEKLPKQILSITILVTSLCSL